ncbi:alpha/beta-hydrolase [Microthyrium microscopicum]|uniref:Carboxylic ester hydrolase n=1 Tax=Microthyrium microscopicum TaxID=703497 RepID=A0A6A6UK93_9PEZI|nr:alpha/beta-hydrolase [Microthyrium microscopicum]
MWSSGISLLALVATRIVAAPTGSAGAPTVTVKNGTYEGLHSAEYKQDFFLGVPYAQPPLGDLRFRIPQSLNKTWTGVHAAKAYSPECFGYSSDQWNYQVSEDCLYLNIVRPAGYDGQKLPVAFWIHGGGFNAGGGVDQRYNTSWTIKNAVEMGKPIVTVSINYRLSAWGFLNSKEVVASGNTNAGLRDQRLALHWVQENIAAFGGDPTKVTIWGESAGAGSVGLHLTAYGGRDDKLFRGAVMESGNPSLMSSTSGDKYQNLYNLLTKEAGCSNSTESLQCLRTVSTEKMNKIINGTVLPGSGSAPPGMPGATRSVLINFGPATDGDIISNDLNKQLPAGKFVHVPVISGANSDEGLDFAPRGMNTEQDFYDSLAKGSERNAALPAELAKQLLKAYPNDHTVQVGASLGSAQLGAPFGAQFRRAGSYYGDKAFIAGRRLTCQTWAAAGLSAYCYRFNAIPAGVKPISAVTHFQEIAFVFYNLQGIGYPPVSINPFTDKSASYSTLSKFMNSNWVSFIHDQDPNAWRSKWNGTEALWPKYDLTKPKDYVFDANVTSYAEDDTFRAEGIKLINDYALGRWSPSSA